MLLAACHSSNRRSYATLFEARFQQLDTLCLRLEAVTTQLTRAIEKLPSHVQPSPHGESVATELEHVSQHLKSLLDPMDSGAASGASHTEFAPSEPEPDADYRDASHHPSPDPEIEANLSDESVDLAVQHDPTLESFGSLVPDSYGKLRFIGGASNQLLVKSIQNLATDNTQKDPDPNALVSSMRQGPDQRDGNPSVEVPLFIQGLKWRELPYLPKPEDLNLPPRYIADMLIGLYFDQLHYTFPVLFKPHFMDRYTRLYVTQKQMPRDREFLSVFFALCACASGLIASGNQSSFPGLEFYEKALLLHFSTTGQANGAISRLEESRGVFVGSRDVSTSLVERILPRQELEAECARPENLNEQPASLKSPLSGFLAFTQLCQISSRIQNLQSPARIASLGSPQGRRRMVKLAKEIEKSLDEWLDGLPDEIRFSAKYVAY
ncbi:hypothetical protein Neosp_013864 [[Neocosmospora] mangrovei]